MLSRKFALLSAFGIWVFALGLLLGDTTLVLASLPVGLYVAFSALGPSPVLDVTVSRFLPGGQTYEGDDVRIQLEISNRGPPVDLEVVDQLPDDVRLASGTNRAFMLLKEGERRSLVYTFTPRLFGTYVFGPAQVRAADRSWARLASAKEGSRGYLRVYPQVKYLNRIEMRHRRPRNWPGEILTRRSGQGMEFYGIREHLPGEPVRRTNWKATARTGNLMVNQYMDEAGGDTLIVLDARSVSEVGTPPDTARAQAARAAATLSYRLLRDRNRVGLFSVGSSLVKVPLGSGRRHFEKIMMGLISTRRGGKDEWGLDLVPYYVSYFFSRMVQVLLISSLVDNAPTSLVAELTRRGYDVLVVSPSPIELDASIRSETRTARLARELAVMERDRKLSLLKSHAQVVDWNPSVPLSDALESLKGTWRARRFT